MILYFTGTGNSKYVADRIADEIGEEAHDLFRRIRDNDYSELHSEKRGLLLLRHTLGGYRVFLEKMAGKNGVVGK